MKVVWQVLREIEEEREVALLLMNTVSPLWMEFGKIHSVTIVKVTSIVTLYRLNLM